MLGTATASLLAICAFFSLTVPAGAQIAGSVFTVNSTADDPDANAGNGVCTTASGACTLRAAIVEANRRAGPDTIAFDIPGTGVQTIALARELPELTDVTGPTTIDGYTQPGSRPNTASLGSNADIGIEIRGGGHDQFNGLAVLSPGNVVRGLAFYNLNKALRIYGVDVRNNHIEGNFVGTNAVGTYRATARVFYANGVHVAGGASNNVIGGASPAERNVLSGNPNHGVGLYNDGTDGNVVVGNLIGLTPSGDARLGNMAHGIDVNTGASNNVIGGISPEERNVIAGNTHEGIEISHGHGPNAPTGNQIVGNYIGTDTTGELAPSYAANGDNGVNLQDGATASEIRNNVIGNSGKNGVAIGSLYSRNNQVSDNWVGVSRGGIAMPNVGSGVQLAAQTTGSRIGPNNVVANNPVGIRIVNTDSDFNTITRNSIHDNVGLGIDIEPLGAVNPNDANDTDTGPNQGLNFPVLESVTPTTARGTACAECAVEVFVADGGAGDYGEGETFAGSTIAGADGSFVASMSGVTVTDSVTATATDVDGNTSEFSDNLAVSQQVDTTNPTISLATPPDGATYTLNEQVAADYACDDEAGGSGIAACDGTVADGELVDTSSPGEKTFTVTARDNAGNASSVTHVYTVSEPPTATTYAADAFSRTVANGWDRADVGGSYALTGKASDFSVGGSFGTIKTPTAGSTHMAYLPDVSTRNVDVTFRMRTDKVATGGGQSVQWVARRIDGGTRYQGQIRFSSSGDVALRAASVVAGRETRLGSEVVVPGLTHTPDTWYNVRAQVSGVDPTTIRMKVWADGQAEPAGWQYTTTDSAASLQTAGSVGLRAVLPRTATNAPILFGFDDYRVTSP